MDRRGLEPLTPALPARCSSQLSYRPTLMRYLREIRILYTIDVYKRQSLENANSVILGKSGGGKSFLVKLEAMRQLIMGTDIIIIDPENEYEQMCNMFGGEFVSFSLSSQYKINPFE